ncbi:MAG: hypothetical protein H6605_05895 [Flavobacteriales bacterium]|nr:hypothetical protein [Flavobacteriales bacterium]
MKSNLYKQILFIAYLFFLFAGLSHHEMWRDEFDWFIQARDTANFFDLGNTMSPGHGAIWRTCLWILTRFTHDPVSLQIFHGLIVLCFAWVLIFKSPFNVWVIAGILFSYFLLFEYALISRNYAFGVLFLFLFAFEYGKKGQLSLPGAIYVFLFCNTSVYAFLLSILIFVYVLYTEFKTLHEEPRKTSNSKLNKILILIGLIFSFIQILPDPNNSFPLEKASLPFNDYRFYMAITQVFSTFLPICRFEDAHFWNTNFLMDEQGLNSWFYIVPLYLISCLPLHKNLPLLLLYLAGTITLLMFQYHTGFRFARYYGHIFLLWVFCLWLIKKLKPENWLEKPIQKLSLTVLLVFQVIGGATMYAADLSLKFSRGKDVVHYIQNSRYKDAYIIGTTDFSMSPISGGLDREIYYLEQGKLSSYTRWDEMRKNDPDSLDYLNAFRSAPADVPFLFICNSSWPMERFFSLESGDKSKAHYLFEDYELQLLKYFKPGIEKHEGYFLFKVVKK